MRIVQIFGLILVVCFLAACAAGPNPAVNTTAGDGQVVGFWYGLWHGMICPITFIISLFEPTVHLYEVHNNGNWYNLGFILGATSVFGGSGGASSRRR